MKPLRGYLDKEYSRPLEDSHTSAAMLLVSPAISGRLDDWGANSLADGDVDSLGDHQKLPSVAHHGRASQALANAMVQEPLSGFGERT
jgi:hypothetical protein